MRAGAALLLLVACSLLLSGCWSRLETNELGVVIAYGMDYERGMYEVTASVLAPKALALPGQTQANPSRPAQLLMTASGPTPGAAFAAVDAESSRRLFWDSAEVAIVGQELAQRGMGPLLSALTHLPDFRPTVRLVIAHGPARAVFQADQSGLETSTGRQLSLTLGNDHRANSYIWAPHLFDLERELSEMDRAALLPALSVTEMPLPQGITYHFSDSAVLSGDRLAGFLPRAEVRPVLWMEGRFVHGQFAVACPGDPGAAGQVRVIAAHRRLSAVIRGETVTALDVSLSGVGQVAQGCPRPTSTAAMGGALDRVVAAAAVQALQWAQAQHLDVVGFGEAVYRFHPRLFLDGYAGSWPADFARLPIRVRVQVRVTLPGISR